MQSGNLSNESVSFANADHYTWDRSNPLSGRITVAFLVNTQNIQLSSFIEQARSFLEI
jgi:hypothetical protein